MLLPIRVRISQRKTLVGAACLRCVNSKRGAESVPLFCTTQMQIIMKTILDAIKRVTKNNVINVSQVVVGLNNTNDTIATFPQKQTMWVKDLWFRVSDSSGVKNLLTTDPTDAVSVNILITEGAVTSWFTGYVDVQFLNRMYDNKMFVGFIFEGQNLTVRAKHEGSVFAGTCIVDIQITYDEVELEDGWSISPTGDIMFKGVLQ